MPTETLQTGILLTLSPRNPAEGEYQQINRHRWKDGRYDEHKLSGLLVDNQIIWDTERIKGKAWEADENTIVMNYVYKSDPNQLIYEFIQISPDGDHRVRTRHSFKDGALIKRTLINELRVHV